MFGAGAVLGPLLDHQHSRFDVLHYDVAPLVLRLPPELLSSDLMLAPWLRTFVEDLFWRESGGLETAAWVPLMFGFASVVIGLGHTLGDDQVRRTAAQAQAKPPAAPRTGYEPHWLAVAAAISAFALQYALSGVLQFDPPAWMRNAPWSLDALLACIAFAIYAAVDGTEQGLAMAVLTALAGPSAELMLINGLHLYHYTQPAWHGVPTWIPWVYCGGSPAVGALCRAVRAHLRGQQTEAAAAVAAAARQALPGAALTSPFASAASAARVARRALPVVEGVLEVPQEGRPTPPPAPAEMQEAIDVSPVMPEPADEQDAVQPAAVERRSSSSWALKILEVPPGPRREALIDAMRARIDAALAALAARPERGRLARAGEAWLNDRKAALRQITRNLTARPARPDARQQLRELRERLTEVETLVAGARRAGPRRDADAARARASAARMLRAELDEIREVLARVDGGGEDTRSRR